MFIIVAMFLQDGDRAVYLGGCTQKLVSLAGLFARKENSAYLKMPAFIQDEQIHSENKSLVPSSYSPF